MPTNPSIPKRDTFKVAKQFISLIKNVENKTIDYKEAKLKLKNSEGRKEVLKVLEDIGCIETEGDVIKWIEYPSKLPASFSELHRLQTDILKLNQKEKQLNLLLTEIKVCLDVTKACDKNAPFAYVDVKDVYNCFHDETLISIEATLDTILKVPQKFSNDENYKYMLLVLKTKEVGLIKESDEKDFEEHEIESDSTIEAQPSEEDNNVQPGCFPPITPIEFPNDFNFSLNESEGVTELFDIDSSSEVAHSFEIRYRLVISDSDSSDLSA